MGEDLADKLDFETLEALPTDRISGRLAMRRVDLLWKIRFREGWLYLLILLEFQSESDHFMALRILTYICLTYEEDWREGFAFEGSGDFTRQGGGGALAREPPASHA